MGNGYRLREVRKQHGMTQAQVASLLGITPNAYNQYENGKRDIPSDSLLLLAKHYGCSTDELLGSWCYYEFCDKGGDDGLHR